jgi:hypothetical protein
MRGEQAAVAEANLRHLAGLMKAEGSAVNQLPPQLRELWETQLHTLIFGNQQKVRPPSVGRSRGVMLAPILHSQERRRGSQPTLRDSAAVHAVPLHSYRSCTAGDSARRQSVIPAAMLPLKRVLWQVRCNRAGALAVPTMPKP